MPRLTRKKLTVLKLAKPTGCELYLRDTEIATCARIEYGLTPVQAEELKANCDYCNVKNAAHSPLHFITCRTARGDNSNQRHDTVRRLFAMLLRSVCFPAK